MELADVPDSKSGGGDTVRVRPPPPAPDQHDPNPFPIGDGSGSLLFPERCEDMPYAANELKRLMKTPKLYFCDTGFCAYLSSWTSRAVLMNGAASGHYYENYVISELMRHYAYGKSRVDLNFYRDNKMKEIDLVIEENGILHPVEIRKTASPDKSAIKAFSVLRSAERRVGTGAVICMSDRVLPFDESNFAVPSCII